MCLPRINPSNKWNFLFDLKVNCLFTSPLQYKKPSPRHPKLLSHYQINNTTF